MLPFVSLSCSAQPPPLIVPLSVSPPMLPVDVTGRSEETLPNEVCAVRLYPSPGGICTRMDENEVFNRRSRQPLVGRLAVTAIPPFWLSTLIFPPIPSSVTPAKDVLTFASPFTFRALPSCCCSLRLNSRSRARSKRCQSSFSHKCLRQYPRV